MKNKLLRYIAFVLAMIMFVMSLSACDKKKEETGTKKPTSGQSQTPSKDEDTVSDTTSDTQTDNSSDNYEITDTFTESNSSTPTLNIDNIVWDNETSAGGESSSDSNSDMTVAYPVTNMFDGKADTYWMIESAGTTTAEFTLDKEVTFNTVVFEEYKDYISDYYIEVKQSGTWVQIYSQDEMCNRTGVLDKNFTAKDFRLTVTTTEEFGGISEMKFTLVDKFDASNFSNVGYFTVSRIERIRSNGYNELIGLTDIILFDFGSWDKDGNFLWGSMGKKYNEDYLKEILQEINTVLNGQPIRIWFSLQNYDKSSVTDPAVLFVTEDSRKKLADFAVELCDKYGFYGVDIDYEYPHWSNTDPDTPWINYDKFLKLAADKLHAKGYKLSAAMSVNTRHLTKETIKSIDKVNMMAYDLIDSKGRFSSYAVVERCVTYFTDLGFEKSQLVLGLPFYTKTTTNEGGQGWYWVINRWRGAIKSYVNSAYNDKYVFWFNGPDMIRDKTFAAMQQGLGGVFCWCMGCDVPDSNPACLSKVVEDTIARFSK